jgi:hypothetical protein
MKQFIIKYYIWGITIFSIMGVILNIYKNSICFIIWTATNLIWCIFNFKKKIYAQSFLFFIYFILAIWGLIEWVK